MGNYDNFWLHHCISLNDQQNLWTNIAIYWSVFLCSWNSSSYTIEHKTYFHFIWCKSLQVVNFYSVAESSIAWIFFSFSLYPPIISLQRIWSHIFRNFGSIGTEAKANMPVIMKCPHDKLKERQVRYRPRMLWSWYLHRGLWIPITATCSPMTCPRVPPSNQLSILTLTSKMPRKGTIRVDQMAVQKVLCRPSRSRLLPLPGWPWTWTQSAHPVRMMHGTYMLSLSRWRHRCHANCCVEKWSSEWNKLSQRVQN